MLIALIIVSSIAVYLAFALGFLFFIIWYEDREESRRGNR